MPTLRDLRKRSYLSQAALAEKAGISRETISRYETGHQKPSSRNIAILVKLAEVLHVKPEKLNFPEKPKLTQAFPGIKTTDQPKDQLELFVFTLDNGIREMLGDISPKTIRNHFGQETIADYILKIRQKDSSSRRKKLLRK